MRVARKGSKQNGPGSSRAVLCLRLEATMGFEPMMGVLQTPALPLGYVALELVPRRGFEPLRPYGHRPLKTACLPIPPPRQPQYLTDCGEDAATRSVLSLTEHIVRRVVSPWGWPGSLAQGTVARSPNRRRRCCTRSPSGQWCCR